MMSSFRGVIMPNKNFIVSLKLNMQLVEYPMLPENITIGDNPFSNLVLRESKLSPNRLVYC